MPQLPVTTELCLGCSLDTALCHLARARSVLREPVLYSHCSSYCWSLAVLFQDAHQELWSYLWTEKQPLLILPVTVFLFFIPFCSLKPQLFFQGLFYELIHLPQVSFIGAAVFVWVSVPAFVLSLLDQALVLSADFKLTASALSFGYLMHKHLSRCNI